MNAFGAIQIIAEQRINEAQAKGEFDNLPGMGQPLPEEDLSAVPPELRMAWRILKNAGCLPPEVEKRKEISRLSDLLENCHDEKERLAAMRRLRALLQNSTQDRLAALEANDEYYYKILGRLERHERKGG